MPRPKTRVSVGMDADTISELDHLVIDEGYQSRSQLIAELVEERLGDAGGDDDDDDDDTGDDDDTEDDD